MNIALAQTVTQRQLGKSEIITEKNIMKTRYYLITVHLLGLFLATVSMAATNRMLTANGDGAVITPPWVCGQNALKQFTVSAWINPSTSTGISNRVVLERSISLPVGNPMALQPSIRANFRLGVDPNGCPYVGYHGSGLEGLYVQATAPSINAVGEGKWTHLSANYAAGNLELYVNGTLVSSNSSAEIPCRGWFGSGPISFAEPATITIGAKNNDPTGATTNLDSCFTGAIDEVVVWNGALSDTQIRASMNTKPTGTESNLVGYWSFDDGTARDMSTNAVNGVYYNSTNVTKNIAYPTTARIDLFPEVAISFQTIQDMTYQVQSSNDLTSTNWTPTNTNVTGNGFEMTVLETNAMWLARFYRVSSF